MTQPLHPIESVFLQAWPPDDWRESHVVFAVSGGADSVAMLRAGLAIKHRCGGQGRLFVAHLNHGLRGQASADDTEWLKILCHRLGVPLEIGKADVAAVASEQGDGLEAAARTARYEFLQQTAERLGARFLAVAHTADDQIETVLHRLLRGTGIDGLRGIPVFRALAPSVTLTRPLLGIRRRDVLNYLAEIGQDYRTDASNADLRWTRNRLRHELLPAIREYYQGEVDDALLRLSVQAGETQAFISTLAAPLAGECVTFEYSPSQHEAHQQVCRIRIRCEKLADQPSLIVREVCKQAWQHSGWPRQAMGFDQWQLLASIVSNESHPSIVNLPGNIRASRDGLEFVLERRGLP
jgi:tRNA(Ile)-lysidine synthase